MPPVDPAVPADPKNEEPAKSVAPVDPALTAASTPLSSTEPLRTDGPTLEEYVAAGYAAEGYPPPGYAVRVLTDEEKLARNRNIVATLKPQVTAAEVEIAVLEKKLAPPPVLPWRVTLANNFKTTETMVVAAAGDDAGQAGQNAMRANPGWTAKHDKTVNVG